MDHPHILGFLFICLCLFVRPSAGNAWLMDPPSRSAAWNYNIKAPVNYDFRTLNCGDAKVEIQPDGSRNCGLCGDPVTDPEPRPNENGGIYAPTVILTRYFESGSTAEISIYNNYPNQPGFYEFRLCDNGTYTPTQECLDENLLFIEDSNDYKMPVPGQGLNRIQVQLPAGLTCSHCLLQWRFKKDNSAWGCDQASGWCGLGYGAQKEYYNCADIMIGAVGMPKPDVIQDPTYTDADYGSAYDMLTTQGPTQTTTDNRVGPTTPPIVSTNSPVTTTRPPIITIPPVTTRSPSTSSAPPTDDKLVVIDASDLNNPMVIFDDGRNNNNNNAGLLLLLGLLPILGALAQNGNTAPAALPAALPVSTVGGPLPPLSPSAFWNQGGYTGQTYLSEFALGNSFGYGNFGGSHGGNYALKGQDYGNKNSYYGNSNTYGTSLGLQSSSIGNNLGIYSSGSVGINGIGNSNSYFGSSQRNLVNGQLIPNGLTGINSQNTWGTNNFLVKSEAVVNNGISRQAINNQPFSNSNGIQGQQNQYPSNHPHKYPTGWKQQQNEYSNNHVDSYHQKHPVQPHTQSQSSGWNSLNNNGWNTVNNNGWSNRNSNTFSNANTGVGNANNKNGLNSNINFNSNSLNFNNGWTNSNGNGWNNNVNTNNGFNNRNDAGNQLRPRTSGVSQAVQSQRQQIPRNQFSPFVHSNAQPWNQGNSQTINQGTIAQGQPQIHELYYKLLSGSRNPQSFNWQAGNRLNALPERAM